MSEPSYLREIPFDIVKEVALKLDYDDIIKIEDLYNFKFDDYFWEDYFKKYFSEFIVFKNYRLAVLNNKTLLKQIRSGNVYRMLLISESAEKGFEKLLDKLELVDFECDNVIEYAIDEGLQHIVKYLLSCADVTPEKLNEYYFSARSLDIIKLLEETNMVTPETRDRFLIVAAWRGDLDMVKYLVDKNADVKFNNSEAINIAEAYASEYSGDPEGRKYKEVVEFLLKNGNSSFDINEDYGTRMYSDIEWHGLMVPIWARYL